MCYLQTSETCHKMSVIGLLWSFIQECVGLCRTNINMKLCCMNSFIHLQSTQLLHTCRNLRNLRYYIEYYLCHGTLSFSILHTYMLSVIHDCKNSQDVSHYSNHAILVSAADTWILDVINPI